MQLFVRSTQTHTLDVTDCSTVEDVKNLVNEKEGLSLDDLTVFYAGKPLTSEIQLCRLENLSTLDVQVRMLGGKVHGSLARAGKVKGQTPKVDKEEKKKLKTGRAKRRMQYNRRFVNVVATFGKRKGPNANS